MIDNLNNDSESWIKAANAIRTTDTYAKYHSENSDKNNKSIFINGLAKGSGMIAPNMATMLSFIITTQIYPRRIAWKNLNNVSIKPLIQ